MADYVWILGRNKMSTHLSTHYLVGNIYQGNYKYVVLDVTNGMVTYMIHRTPDIDPGPYIRVVDIKEFNRRVRFCQLVQVESE